MKPIVGMPICAAVFAVSALTGIAWAANASSKYPLTGTITEVSTIAVAKKPTRTVTEVITWSGRNLRKEREAQQGRPKQISILNNGTWYMYLPDSKPLTVAKRKAPGALKERSFLEGLINRANMVKSRGKKMGMESSGGFSCDVYNYSESLKNPGKPGMTGKLWINRDPKLPIITKATLAAPGMHTITMVMKNARIGIPVPQSKFALPKGAKVVDMAKLHSGLKPGMNPRSGGQKPSSAQTKPKPARQR